MATVKAGFPVLFVFSCSYLFGHMGGMPFGLRFHGHDPNPKIKGQLTCGRLLQQHLCSFIKTCMRDLQNSVCNAHKM